MGRSPHQRSRQQRRTERRLAMREAELRRARRRRLYAGALVLAIVAMALSTIIGAAISADSDNDAAEEVDPIEGDTPTTTPLPTGPPASLTVPPPGEAIAGETPCPASDGSSPRVTSFEQVPPVCIEPAKAYHALVRTSEGDMTIVLNHETAPIAVNNFVVLARYHYYDGVPFHMMFPQGFIVTGDATADPSLGKGGPGYVIETEVDPAVGAIYPFGTVAMWHKPSGPDVNTVEGFPIGMAGIDGPEGDGSQFLIATGQQAVGLPPEFTPFGLVTEGIEAINAIQRMGSPVTGQPFGEAWIEEIEILELDQ